VRWCSDQEQSPVKLIPPRTDLFLEAIASFPCITPIGQLTGHIPKTRGYPDFCYPHVHSDTSEIKMLESVYMVSKWVWLARMSPMLKLVFCI